MNDWRDKVRNPEPYAVGLERVKRDMEEMTADRTLTMNDRAANSFGEIRASLETRFEDMLLDIYGIRRPDGIVLGVDPMPITEEFILLMNSVERAYMSASNN